MNCNEDSYVRLRVVVVVESAAVFPAFEGATEDEAETGVGHGLYFLAEFVVLCQFGDAGVEVEEEEVGEPVEEGGEADGGEDGGDEEGVVLHDGDEGGGEFAGHDDVLEEGFQDGLVLGHDAKVAAEEA